MYYPMRVIETRCWKLILNLAHELSFPFASDLWESATWQSVAKKGESHYGGRLVADYLQRAKYELYDKQSDPEEFRNVAGEPANAAILAELSTKMREFQTRTCDPWVVKYEHE
jgi:N-sulfoglucosamine sulfohydrolase